MQRLSLHWRKNCQSLCTSKKCSTVFTFRGFKETLTPLRSLRRGGSGGSGGSPPREDINEREYLILLRSLKRGGLGGDNKREYLKRIRKNPSHQPFEQ